jgi:hypothetical protein
MGRHKSGIVLGSSTDRRVMLWNSATKKYLTALVSTGTAVSFTQFCGMSEDTTYYAQYNGATNFMELYTLNSGTYTLSDSLNMGSILITFLGELLIVNKSNGLYGIKGYYSNTLVNLRIN